MRIMAAVAAGIVLFAAGAGADAGKLSGRRAPSFALPDINLNYHDILDYRGKVLILEVLRTDCPVCQSMQKIVQRVAADYAGKVNVLSIVMPPDNQDTVHRFAGIYNVKTPILFDSGQTVAIYMKATPQNPSVELPHLFLIDAKGQIRNDYSLVGSEPVFETVDPLMREVGALVQELDAKK